MRILALLGVVTLATADSGSAQVVYRARVTLLGARAGHTYCSTVLLDGARLFLGPERGMCDRRHRDSLPLRVYLSPLTDAGSDGFIVVSATVLDSVTSREVRHYQLPAVRMPFRPGVFRYNIELQASTLPGATAGYQLELAVQPCLANGVCEDADEGRPNPSADIEGPGAPHD